MTKPKGPESLLFRFSPEVRRLMEKGAKRRGVSMNAYLLALVHEEEVRQAGVKIGQALDLDGQFQGRLEREEAARLLAEIENLREALRDAVIPATGEGFTYRQLASVLSTEEIARFLTFSFAERKQAYDRLSLAATVLGHQGRVVRSAAPRDRIRVSPAVFWRFVEKEATAEEKAEIKAAILGTEATEEEESPNERDRSPRPRRPRT